MNAVETEQASGCVSVSEVEQVQKSLLSLLPYWNYRIAKPFKHLLDDGVSLEMYCFLQILRRAGGSITMSEFAPRVQMQKQQMTKIVNRLVELEFVERIYDPSDRRIIKIQITEKASAYMDHLLEEATGCFARLLECMDEKDFSDFKLAIDIFAAILPKLPWDWNK